MPRAMFNIPHYISDSPLSDSENGIVWLPIKTKPSA